MNVTVTERYTSGEFLLRDRSSISRSVVTFDNTTGSSDLLVEAGTVIQQSPPATAVVTPAPSNNGNGVLSGVQPNLVPWQFGVYDVIFTSSSTFVVTAPDGSVLQPGSVGSAYFDQVGFQINAGGIPFVAGDGFALTISDGTPPAATAYSSNTGNGSLGNIGGAGSAVVEFGNYLIKFSTISSTSFSVFSPSGRELSPGVVGTYYQDEISFLLSAGNVPFAIGDSFTVGVAAGTGHVVAWNGSSPPIGVIFETDYVPAGGSLPMVAIVRYAEVIASALRFPNQNAAASKQTAISALRALNILAR